VRRVARRQDGDRRGAQAARRARGVERGRAAADHGDRVADTHLPALAHLAQQVEALDDGLAAGDLRGRRLPRAHGDEDGVEAGVAQPFDGDLVAERGVVDETHAGLPERLELAVEDPLGQAELGDAVAQRPAGLLVGVVHGDPVTLLGEVPRGSEAGRAGADDGDPPAAGHAGREDRAPMVRGGPVQGADGDRVVDLAAAAGRLAVARADAAEDAGEGQVAAHDGGGAGGVAVGQRRDVGGDVDVRRAGVGAGRLAVAVVVRQVHLEVARALLAHARRVGPHDHAVAHPRGAGRLELGLALDLDEAEAAGAPRRRPLHLTEGGDVDALATGDREHGLARLRAEPLAVDDDLDGGRGPRTHCCLPSATASIPVSTGIASNLHTWRQVSHLMQSFWSMTWTCLASPLMAWAGQAVRHR